VTASRLYPANPALDPWFGFMATHPPLIHDAEAAGKAAGNRLYQESLRRTRAAAKIHAANL